VLSQEAAKFTCATSPCLGLSQSNEHLFIDERLPKPDHMKETGQNTTVQFSLLLLLLLLRRRRPLSLSSFFVQ
jgi:hypothetical protein